MWALGTEVLEHSGLRQGQRGGDCRKIVFFLKEGIEHMFRYVIFCLNILESEKSVSDRMDKVTKLEQYSLSPRFHPVVR